MQFGFQEGVGCTEASFTIFETVNHMFELTNKVFSCFLDVRKAFDTVQINRILYKLFSELRIGDEKWKVKKGNMILNAILCIQHYCSFGGMLFI